MFISYAQNLEDVMLSRALREVKQGFYIDANAQDPTIDSVTKAFYERGWRGINMEPVARWFERLKAERPEDVNLQLAAWSRPATIRIFEIVGTAFSTMDATLAGRHAAQGFTVREVDVLARPLQAVCAELGVKEVHFLKVGVEGAEPEVLAGLDLRAFRPWIIVVKSTGLDSLERTHERWEPFVTARGYELAYLDGVNRFYVARERDGLKAAFAVPPNHHDRYVRFSEWRAEERASALETERAALQNEGELLRRRLRQAESEKAALGQAAYILRLGLAEERRVSAELRRNLEDLLVSRSMRATKLLRDAMRWASSLKRAGRGALEGPAGMVRRMGAVASDQPVVAEIRRRLRRRTGLPVVGAAEAAGGEARAAEAEARGFAVAEAMHPLVDLAELQARLRRAVQSSA